MKITTWNCNMAFRKKAESILLEQPDILIVPECENLERLTFAKGTTLPHDMFWYGDNVHKGIGVFSYSDFKIELLGIHNPAFKYVIPLTVRNAKMKLTVLAIWSQKPAHNGNYTEQVWNAIHFYTDLLDAENVLLAGDFNSNAFWDKPKRLANHSNLVAFLKNKQITSTYHAFHKEIQGKEADSTFFLHRKLDRPYHLDFCFASAHLMDKLTNVEIGSYASWSKLSDHMPLTVTFNM